MINLNATYRLQFHKEFTFRDLERIIPYLKMLGIGAVYASPVFAATPSSTHGYDGLDPHRINPEVGTKEQLVSLSRELRLADINWLQDIVPNHMAYDTRNEWLMDLLEKGPQSVYARFFDTAWTSPLFQGRLMVPFLGAPLEQVLRNGELKISWEGQRFVFKYYDAAYPLQPLSYRTILEPAEGAMPDAIGQLLSTLPKEEDEQEYALAWEEVRLQLDGLLKNDQVKSYIEKRLGTINADQGLLQKIEGEQSYNLCCWQETDKRINYRRFFTVNGLVCLNIQDPEVFDHYHELIRSLLEEGVFTGLRIDHIDGLFDPSAYLQRLRQVAGEEIPIVVEKILLPSESLPGQWPIEGNTGYDFLALVNNLLTNRNAEKTFTRFYRRLEGDHKPVSEQVHDKKAYILFNHMGGELDNLYQLFRQQGLVEKRIFASIRPEELKEAMGEFLIRCPVYRFYGNRFPLEEQEAAAVRNILNDIRRSNGELARAVAVLESALLQMPQQGREDMNEKLCYFYQRCMQYTGPLMAKGVEDTLMYTYNRFIGHNEVGDSPGSFGITMADFHQAMKERLQRWPLSLNATSTHDTKRGEDVRARLNVLTDIPEEWFQVVEDWQKNQDELKTNGMPDANDAYFIYQTLVGAHPMPGQEEDNFRDRMAQYLQKALREAKRHSNWTTPNQSYEEAAISFASRLLDPEKPYSNNLRNLIQKIADHGIVNSLSQVVLKFTCPGIPDVYQGCELWDLSLVDPDNRRQVDYEKRKKWLEQFTGSEDLKQLWDTRYEGRIKLWLTKTLFTLRQQQPDLFSMGEYLPLQVEGKYKDHVIAFARKHRQQVLIVALPLHTAILCREQGKDIPEIDWKDTEVLLPEGVTDEWQHILEGSLGTYKVSLKAADLFKTWPVALLKGQGMFNERGAGILLHLSSLPSAFGIGDMGPEAKAFADFLSRSRQKYWQMLPLGPTEEGQGHSPYSSISSRAGNILFISLELLAKEKLLDAAELQAYRLGQEGKANYREAERVKAELFEKAWTAYKKGKGTHLKKDYEVFREKEMAWLDDFALYVLLKQKQGGKPWYEWDAALKMRQEAALQEVRKTSEDVIEKIKWLQFIFHRQWSALKAYCNNKGILLIGDLPFYVSYDSADVWAHRRFFALDEQGNRTGMAGVPPDAFSADGQLWGMPVFNWDELREDDYSWWIERLRKNMELFDIVRLDHFRAFADYWEVPAGEQTARNGNWKKGPAAGFFDTVQKELGELPFVAEDLGEIDESVYRLRDQFNLPGMKVLQFAFGSDMPRSVHIPHNYDHNFVVYTGTHDNNTTRGWFTKDADEQSRLGLETYIGRAVSAAEVNMVLARMAYGSVARIAILPLQDVLNLDENARMNTPSSAQDNWSWRLMPGQITGVAEENLRKWTQIYNRD